MGLAATGAAPVKSAVCPAHEDRAPDNICYQKKRDGKRAKNKSWSQAEDVRLLQAVSLYGVSAWSVVAQYVGGGRTRSQCSQRWVRGLDPSISRGRWTRQEEDKLCMLVEKYGTNQWVKVATELGKRCDVQCRYRYSQILKKREVKEALPPIDAILGKVEDASVKVSIDNLLN